jgi:hypothetical protein
MLALAVFAAVAAAVAIFAAAMSLGMVSMCLIFIVMRRLRHVQHEHARVVFAPAPRGPRCHQQRRRV